MAAGVEGRRRAGSVKRPGVIVCDLDGTLALRGRPVPAKTLAVLAALGARGWQVVLLSGQPISNIRRRLPRRTDAPIRLDVHTCEGAMRWEYRSGRWAARHSLSSKLPFGVAVRTWLRRAVEHWLKAQSPKPIKVIERPQWWERSVLIFRVAAKRPERPRLARELNEFMTRQLSGGRRLPPLRVGIAGRTTMVVGHRNVHKEAVLRQIVREAGPLAVIYVADEFAPLGNDACALTVPRLVRINVGRWPKAPRDLVSSVGVGPTAARRFLAALLQSSGEGTRTTRREGQGV